MPNDDVEGPADDEFDMHEVYQNLRLMRESWQPQEEEEQEHFKVTFPGGRWSMLLHGRKVAAVVGQENSELAREYIGATGGKHSAYFDLVRYSEEGQTLAVEWCAKQTFLALHYESKNRVYDEAEFVEYAESFAYDQDFLNILRHEDPDLSWRAQQIQALPKTLTKATAKSKAKRKAKAKAQPS